MGAGAPSSPKKPEGPLTKEKVMELAGDKFSEERFNELAVDGVLPEQAWNKEVAAEEKKEEPAAEEKKEEPATEEKKEETKKLLAALVPKPSDFSEGGWKYEAQPQHGDDVDFMLGLKGSLNKDGSFSSGERWNNLKPPETPMETISKVDGLIFSVNNKSGWCDNCGRAMFRENGTCYLVYIYNGRSVTSWGLKRSSCSIEIADGTYEKQEDGVLICTWKHHVQQSHDDESPAPDKWEPMDERASLKWNRLVLLA